MSEIFELVFWILLYLGVGFVIETTCRFATIKSGGGPDDIPPLITVGGRLWGPSCL